MQTKPKLRFKEFNNNWNNFALKEFCIINPNNNKTLPNKFFYIDLESVINGQIACKLNAINKDNAPSRAARILQVNDLLYQTVRPYQRNNYLFSNELELPTVASTGYAQMRTTKNSIKFLYQLIHTDEFVNNVMKRCTGTSYPAINSTDLSNIIISVPNIEEQEKIAGFLSKVDELINECESEVKDLEEQKKGLMQKIFSQQIRFKDSNNNPYPDWKEKKIEDIATLTSSKRIHASDYVPKGIPFYRGKEITELKTNKKISELLYISEDIYDEYKMKYGAPQKNDILVTAVGTLGNVWAVDNEYPFYFKDGNLIWFKYVKENSKFIEYLLLSPKGKKKLLNSAIGSNQKALTIVGINKLHFKFPCQEEQEKIAKVLSKIDELIEEKKELLSDWQQFKKGLLQQMFV